MADDERELEMVHYWGAAVLGLLVSIAIWLAIGHGLIVKIGWVVIGVLLLATTRLLPGRAARVVLGLCYAFGFSALMFLAGLFTLMPGAMAYSFSKTVVETFPRWLQVVTLLVWFLLLACAALLLYSRTARDRARKWLRTKAPSKLREFKPPERVEPWGAIALYINFVFIAMGCFAGIAFLLQGFSSPPLFLPGTNPVSHGSLADFLVWHLLDAIPGLKVPETIRWTAPLTYERSGAGWLLLLFKVMVIVPVVSGIGYYLKDEEPHGDGSSSGTRGAARGASRPATRG